MRALIADDEPIARQVLREQLEDFPAVEVVGEAATGLEARELIERLRPDIVFLDLQMPEMDGFAVARSLRRERLPLVIFVTAYDHRALDAFETGAVDYLLKPVRRERLSAALEKAGTQLAGLAGRPSRPERARKIVGRAGGEMHILDPADVIAFRAEGDLVYVLTAARKYFSAHTLKELEERLEPARFRRVHRQTIINTDHIRKLSPLSSKRWLLSMSNGMEVVVSKRLGGAIRDETHW